MARAGRAIRKWEEGAMRVVPQNPASKIAGRSPPVSHLRLGSVPLFVSDQQRALEFYRDALGLQVALDVPIGPKDRWLAMSRGPSDAELLLFRPGMYGKDSESLSDRVGVWTGIVFLTDDIEASYSEVKSKGVKFVSEPKCQMWGGIEASFSDPDNNRFQLVQRPDGMRGAPAERISRSAARMLSPKCSRTSWSKYARTIR
jgi:lactoylglutathione lyase